ncbi:MAG: GNAT family N-acetyltransferase [Acidobacteria bacterium]|nr:GNAT family N-acetyltransferase [Acidobacteriota bacterium]
MTEAHYRPVREAEMPEAVELFLATVADLNQRWNLNWPLPPREYIEKVYDYIRRTGIFLVAEVDGKLGAICHAIVRDHLWFLSGFWTIPHLQGQKVGRPLLKQVWDEGAAAGASVFFTWSSIDLQAMASYMKMGMLPGYQLLNFYGQPCKLPEKRCGYETQPLELSAAMEIDEQIRATRREPDHQFWVTEVKLEGRQMMCADRIVGYYYLNKGTVGPAAWLEDEDAEALLESACREAFAQAEQIRLIVPGANHAAIRFALQMNLKLSGYGHLLTTAPFGQMEKYLTSGPSLF